MSPRTGQSRTQSFSAGSVILRKGETDTCAYVILRGRIEVFNEDQGKKVVLARLGPGQIFGEMNLILESTRTASVSALEDTSLRIINRDAFNRLLRVHPVSILPFLRVLFERFRNLNSKYLDAAAGQERSRGANRGYHGQGSATSPVVPDADNGVGYSVGAAGRTTRPDTERPVEAAPGETSPRGESSSGRRTSEPSGGVLPPLLEGLTPEAQAALRGKKLEIKSFPFKIGRRHQGIRLDFLSFNDLHLEDAAPFNVSRNHCSINESPAGGYFIQDRGSTLGTIVNGVKVGSDGQNQQRELDGPQNTVILGSERSPFKFRITIR